MEWFISGSYGQFDDVGNTDADMYALQVGRRFSSFGGFDVAAYLELAYLDGENDFTYEVGTVQYDGNIDTEVIPLTINLMLERNLVGGLGFYAGGGIGYAWTDGEIDGNGPASVEFDLDSSGGFYGQLSMGLYYKFTEAFSVFAGARWIYLGELEFGDSDSQLPDSSDNAWGWEGGLRFSF